MSYGFIPKAVPSDTYDESGDDYDDYPIYQKYRNTNNVEYLPQRLDAPLLDMSLIKMKLVLGLITKQKAYERLRTGCSTKREAMFINQVNADAGNIINKNTARFFNYSTVVRFCNDLRHSIERDDVLLPDPGLFTNICQSASDALKSWGVTRGLPVFDLKEVLISDTQLSNYYLWNFLMEKLYDRRRYLSVHNRHGSLVKCPVGKNVIYLNGSFMAIHRLTDNTVTLGTNDMFLSLLDISRVRWNTRLASYVLDKSDLLRNMIEQQYRWQEECLLMYNDAGYEIAKSTEALWKTFVSRKTEGSYSAVDSFDRMIEKIKDKEIKLRSESNGTQDGLPFMSDKFIELTNILEVDQDAVELFGITKSIGHPLINPELGGRSAREHAQSEDTSIPSSVIRQGQTFKHMCLLNYIKKFGKWPPLATKESFASTQLGSLHASNQLHIPDLSYPLEDWEHADIDKIFDFNYFTDFLTLLKDKSCAPPRSETEKFYHKKGTDRTDRRILAKMLKDPVTNTKELIREFSMNLLSKEEYNILLYPKECEFKLNARMFAMLTYKMRLIMSIIQENVKEGVFSLLPYQSMTMDNVQLTKTLLAMTAKDSAEETIFIEVDLSRWNLCFRHMLIKNIGVTIDGMFGVKNVFGRSHEVFVQSLVTVLVGDQRIPQFEKDGPVHNDTQWENSHEGGFEGIDQATWTVSTGTMMYSALWGENCRFILMGQGDNQTLAISRPKGSSEPLEVFAQRIMKKIEIACKEVNHVAKPEEFVDSTSTLTYSKVFLVNGKIMPMELKYAMKILPVTNSEIPSLADALGAISSAAVGSAGNSKDPLRHWQLAILQQVLLINRFWLYGGWMGDDFKKTIRTQDPEAMKLMLTIPSVLGGFPISSLTSFICRNEPDPLTTDIAWLRRLSRVDYTYAQFYSYIKSNKPYYEKIKSLQKLIDDPYSLPFIQPPTQRSAMEKQSTQTLKAITQNRDIQQLIHADDTIQEEDFIDTICSMSPMYALIAHDMKKVSVYGKLDEIKKMFTLTRTLVTTSRSKAANNSQLMEAEWKYTTQVLLRFMLAGMEKKSIDDPKISSYTVTQQLRDKWGIPGGIVGVTTSHPLDYQMDYSTDNVKGLRIYLTCDPKVAMNTRGKERPYLAIRTGEKKVASLTEIQTSSNVQEMKKLVLLSTTVRFDNTGEDVLNNITKSRTLYPLSQLKELFPTIQGGNPAHRYALFNEKNAIGPVGNPTLSTNLVFNSNNIDGLSGTKKDYPVAFQQYHSYVYFGLREALLNNQDVRSCSINLTVDNLPELIDYDVVTQKPLTLALPDFSQNNIVRVDELYLKIGQQLEIDHNVLPTEFKDPSQCLSDNDQLQSMLSTLIHYWSKKIKNILSTHIAAKDDPSFGIQTYRFDITVLNRLQGRMLYLATIEAIMRDVVPLLINDRIHVLDQSRVYQLCQTAAQYVIKTWSYGLTMDTPIRNYCELDLDIRSVPGSSGFTHTVNSLIANLANDTSTKFCHYYSIAAIRRFDVMFSKSVTFKKSDVVRENICQVLWTIQVATRQDDAKTQQDVRSLVTEYLKTPAYQANTLDTLMTILVKSRRILYQNMSESSKYTLIYTSKADHHAVTAFQTTEEEVHRLMRELPIINPSTISNDDNSDTLISLSDKYENKITFSSVPREGLPSGYPRYLSPSKPPSLITSIQRRTQYRYGIYSTAGAKYYGILSSELSSRSDTVGVIGTGAGGIQRLLCDLGVKSIGLDLQESIPPEHLGNISYQPVEITYSKHHQSASLSPLSHTTSGDMMDIRVLQKFLVTQFTELIIDVERGKDRFGFELIDRLIQANYFGRSIVKFYLTRAEIEWMYSSLIDIGAKEVKVYPGDEFTEDEFDTIQVLFAFTLRPLNTYENTVHHVFKISKTVYSNKHLFELPDEHEEIINYILSGSRVRYQGELDSTIVALDNVIASYYTKNGSPIQDHDSACLYVLIMLQELLSYYDNMEDRITVLEQIINDVPRVVKINKRVLHLYTKKKYIKEMLSKQVSRLIS